MIIKFLGPTSLAMMLAATAIAEPPPPSDTDARAYKVAKVKTIQAELKRIQDESLADIKRDINRERAAAAADQAAAAKRIADRNSVPIFDADREALEIKGINDMKSDIMLHARANMRGSKLPTVPVPDAYVAREAQFQAWLIAMPKIGDLGKIIVPGKSVDRVQHELGTVIHASASNGDGTTYELTSGPYNLSVTVTDGRVVNYDASNR